MKEKDLKIFVVDDDVFTAEVYNQFLKNIGYYDTYYFSNGANCISNLKDKPNFILLDSDIEGETYLDILKQIKLVDPSIYVVLLSNDRSQRSKLEALKFGAFDFLLKDETICAKIAKKIAKIIKIAEELKKTNL